jgi:hypothetical protein
MKASKDYKLPYDVELEVEFDVCCSRKTPSSYFELKIANAYGSDFEGLLNEDQKCELRDEWLTWAINEDLQFCDIKLKFEVTFSAKDEIDNVSLNGVDINDIVSKELEQDLIDAAEMQGRE